MGSIPGNGGGRNCGRRREDWIASLPGFWQAVWDVQDDLGILRYRGGATRAPLPLGFARLYFLLRDAEARVRRYGPLPPPEVAEPEITEEAVNGLLAEVLWLEAWTLGRCFGLAPSDTQFVASCVYGGIEDYVAGRCSSDPLVSVVSLRPDDYESRDYHGKHGAMRGHFAPGRIYVDVTESLDPERDVAALVPQIEAVQAELGVDLSWRSDPISVGRPRQSVVAAYAMVLNYCGPNGDWRSIVETVNTTFGTQHTDRTLQNSVRRERERSEASSALARWRAAGTEARSAGVVSPN